MRDIFYSIESEGCIVGKRTVFGTIENQDVNKDAPAGGVVELQPSEKLGSLLYKKSNSNLYLRFDKDIDWEKVIEPFYSMENINDVILEVGYSQMVIDKRETWTKLNAELADRYYISFEYEDLSELDIETVYSIISNIIGNGNMIKFVISNEEEFEEHKPWLRKVDGIHPNIFVLLDTQDMDLITSVYNWILEEGIDVRPQTLTHKLVDEIE